jgi:hypothetical protein
MEVHAMSDDDDIDPNIVDFVAEKMEPLQING